MTTSLTTAANATARAGGAFGLRLSSGKRCSLRRRTLPGLQTYYVLALRTEDCSPGDVGEHVHILLARSVADKRRGMLVFQLKHLLRWRRWPLVRQLVELG